MDVILAFIDYQESVESTRPLEGRVKEELTVRAFPTSPRIGYHEVPGYEGLKVFPLDEYLCVSLFYYAGRVDRFRRPILSAKAALLPIHSIQPTFRDIVAVGEALKLVSLGEGSERWFKELVRSRSVIASKSRFRSLAGSFSLDFLADSLSFMASTGKGKLIIYYPSMETAKAFIRLAYTLLPLKVVASRTLTTECEPPIEYCEEDVILLPSEAGRKGLLDSVKRRINSLLERSTRLSGEKASVIDLAKGKTGRGRLRGLFKRVLEELLDEREWYSVEWSEKYDVLVRFIEAVFSGRRVGLSELSEKIRLMKDTVKRIESLEYEAWR